MKSQLRAFVGRINRKPRGIFSALGAFAGNQAAKPTVNWLHKVVLLAGLVILQAAAHAGLPLDTAYWGRYNNGGQCATEGGECAKLDSPTEACQIAMPGASAVGVVSTEHPQDSFNCTSANPFGVNCSNANNDCQAPYHAYRVRFCPANSTPAGTVCNCKQGFEEVNGKCVQKQCCDTVGNPASPANGAKAETLVVYRGPHGFELTLTFGTFNEFAGRFGRHWRDSFDREIRVDGTAVQAHRPSGAVYRFSLASGVWVPDADVDDRLVELQNPPGTRTGWTLTAANGDEVETYDAAGRLVSIKSRHGLTQTLTYSDGTPGPDGAWYEYNPDGTWTPRVLPAGKLVRVTDHFGRVLRLWHTASRVFAVDHGHGSGQTYSFTYSYIQRLQTVKFPDNATRTYVYNEPAHTGGAVLVDVITGIVDENGDRFATFKYDSERRVIQTERAGGALRHTLTYGTGSTTVTGPLGAVRTYNFDLNLGAFRNTSITGAACPDCGPAAQTFDANNNVASRTDWNGNRTNYSYDLTRNLETSRTEGLTSAGATTPQTRTITTAWHSTYRLPVQIAEPLRITTFAYGEPTDSNPGNRGSLLSKTVQATTDTNGSQGLSATPTGTPRTWTYTYNAIGLVLTVNGPRTDVTDTTTYTYHADNDPDLGKRGNVATITNAAGHVTSFTSYNGHGQPLTVVDANGLTTTMTYDIRQRLKTRTVGTETTSYDYDNAGQLTKVTLPDGSFLSYTYDDAHRLTAIDDNLGNRIAYTLDAMGNRTLEEVRDPTNALAQTRSRVFSNLNRLFQELGAQSQTTEYTYDDQGNVLTVKDPLNRITANQYDALNRLKQVTSPAPISAVTQYAYNGLDALAQVTDPRSLATGYTVDGLGNLTQQVSPDTGTTTNTYDAAGNLLTQTDAKSQVTTYAYDALNRVTLITFHDGSKQAYAYDQGTNGTGRLSSITETNPSNQVTSVIAYAYDQHGRMTSETRTVNGVQYVLGYQYNSAGKLDQLTYPSGRTVSYSFDSLGRVSGVTTTKSGGTAQTVVSGVAYHPFGGVKGYTLGNGQVYTRGIDLDGRISSYTLGSQSFAIGYDDASRISFINDIGTPANSNTYGYDNLDRLTSAVLPATPYSYSYDAVGNRTSRTAGTSTDNYTYSSTSNRIASITPASGPVRNFGFDNNGSTTADGINTFVYDVRGRMVQSVSTVGTTTYQVNALGQRIRKTNSFGDTVFQYDTNGRLIAENDAGGTLKRELIYLGDMPVAVFQ